MNERLRIVRSLLFSAESKYTKMLYFGGFVVL